MRAARVSAPSRSCDSKLYQRRPITQPVCPTIPCAVSASHHGSCPSSSTPSTSGSARPLSVAVANQPGRRELLAGAGLLVAAGWVDWPALAEEGQGEASSSRCYVNIKVDGKPFGRLTFELFPDVQVGSQRFADLCKGKQGVGYRLSKFDNINDEYIRNEGVKQLAYGANGVSPIAGGESIENLEDELAQQKRRHDCAGLVSLVVRSANERPVTEKLVAMGGKLVTVKNQAGEVPNGTSFMITRGPAPELDATNLIVGRLVDGWDVLDNLGALPVINDNQESPFFKAGKLIGDKRVLVAEKSFNKPFGKVVVASGGLVAGLVASN